jgi:hypothetical protein
MQKLSRLMVMPVKYNLFLFLSIVLNSAVFSLETSSESVNPFNKFMSSSGGVDMYSGAVAFSHFLLEIAGRGDLKMDVSLQYSSNVFLNARAKNDRAPSGWVGLGWNLSFGGIICDHKSTKTHLDDEFIWVSPNGVPAKIIKKRDSGGNVIYFIENDPYSKVSFRDINSDGIFDGCIVTSVNGIKLKYGDLGFSDNRHATRWTFSEDNYVGLVRNGVVSRYPYRWDLSQKTDSAHNAVNFYYQQVTSPVADDSWNSGSATYGSAYYTQASYLSKIANTDGAVIDFVLNNESTDPCDPNEYFIPYQSTAGVEDLGYFNIYEKRFLKTIIVSKAINGTTAEMKRFQFGYALINQTLTGSFKKRLLTSITETGPGGTTQVTAFNYLSDLAKAQADNTYNYGALESIDSPLGGKTQFTFTRTNIACGQLKTDALGTYDNNFWTDNYNVNNDGNPYYLLQRINGYKGYLSLYQWDGSTWVSQTDFDTLFGISGRDKSEILYNIFTVKSHFVLMAPTMNQYTNHIWVYDWNGKKWIPSKAKVGAGTVFDISADNLINQVGGISSGLASPKCFMSDDYFLLIYTKFTGIPGINRARYARIFQWNGQYWQTQGAERLIDILDDANTGFETGRAMPNYAVVNAHDKIMVFMREDGWAPASFKIGLGAGAAVYNPITMLPGNFELVGTDLGNVSAQKTTFCNGDYFVLSQSVGYRVFQWDRDFWVSTGSGWTPKTIGYCIPHDDYCVAVGGSDIDVLARGGGNVPKWQYALYNQNGGSGSCAAFSANFGAYQQVTASPDGKTIIITYNGYYARMYKYNSVESCWDAVPLPTDPAGSSPYTSAGTDFGITHGSTPITSCVIKDHVVFTSGKYVMMFDWDGHEWNFNHSMSGTLFSLSGAAAANFKFIAVIGGNDFFVFRPQCDASSWSVRQECSGYSVDNYDKLYFYEFNGQQWVQKGFGSDFGDPSHFKRGVVFDNFLVTYGGTGNSKIWFNYKYQDDFVSDSFFTFTVRTKYTGRGISGAGAVSTHFSFDKATAKINSSVGAAQFNKVSSINANNGKTDMYFFNGKTANGQAGFCTDQAGSMNDYLLLDGNVYKTQIFNQANVSTEANALITTKSYFEAYDSLKSWPLGVYNKRILRTVTDNSGVSNETEYLNFVPQTGMAAMTKETNSDGKHKLTKTIFAFEHPAYAAGMGPGGANMLTLPFQTTVYEKAAGDGSTTVSDAEARSSQIFTWSLDLGCAAWAPYKTYAWNVPKSETGVPSSALPGFVDALPDTNWKLTGTAELYNSFGQPVQSKKPGNRGSSVIVYRNDVGIPIGTVDNANFKECGVFTCDYSMNESGTPFNYFDKNNGWEIGVSSTGGMSDTSHFGQQSLHIKNGEGLMRNFKVRGNAAYVLSLWVNALSGSMPIRVEYRTESLPITYWPVPYTSLDSITSTITTNQGPTYGAWKLIKIAVPVGNGTNNWIRITVGFHSATFDAYVDDIRFAPANALVTSTYYDQLWHKPIVSVDPNGNPDHLSEYDDLGRISHVYKLNKNLGSKEAGARTLIASKEYHVTGPGLFQPYNPDPPDGKSDYRLENATLKWDCVHPSGKLLNYDIYWGVSPDNLTKVGTAVTIKTFARNGLKLDSTYYWQVVAREIDDGTMIRGPIWSFKREYMSINETLDHLVANGSWGQMSARYSGQPGIFFYWWPCPIVHPNGLSLSYKIRIKFGSDYGVSCICANDGTRYRCEGSPYLNITSGGFFSVIIDDGVGTPWISPECEFYGDGNYGTWSCPPSP